MIRLRKSRAGGAFARAFLAVALAAGGEMNLLDGIARINAQSWKPV